MLDIFLFILDLLLPIGRKKGNSKEAANLVKRDPKNVVNILLGGLAGILAVEAFYIETTRAWGNIDILSIMIFGVFGGLGGIAGRALANRINESKLTAIIGGALGGALTCGLVIVLFMASGA